MVLKYPLVHIEEVEPETKIPGGGPGVVELRFPIGRSVGCASSAFWGRFNPGATALKHRHEGCDEYVYILSGSGKFGPDGAEVRAGHCRFIPRSGVHWLRNMSDSEPLDVIAFFPGASSMEETAFAMFGEASEEDFGTLSAEEGAKRYPYFHVDNVGLETMERKDGWQINEFRLPISGRHGSADTMFHARFFSGAVHHKHLHRNCDEIYYIISGSGIAGAGPDRAEVRPGHFHYIPKGTEHWLCNLSKTDPVEVVGIYLGAGSVEETGYIYLGEVGEEDIAGGFSS